MPRSLLLFFFYLLVGIFFHLLPTILRCIIFFFFAKPHSGLWRILEHDAPSCDLSVANQALSFATSTLALFSKFLIQSFSSFIIQISHQNGFTNLSGGFLAATMPTSPAVAPPPPEFSCFSGLGVKMPFKKKIITKKPNLFP